MVRYRSTTTSPQGTETQSLTGSASAADSCQVTRLRTMPADLVVVHVPQMPLRHP